MAARYVLRNRKLNRLLALVTTAGTGVFAVTIGGAISAGHISGVAVAIGVVGLLLALASARALRVGVEMTDTGVIVYRPIATEFVAWGDVADVAVDGAGFHIGRRSGGAVTVVGAGASRWAARLHVDGPAESWAADLRLQVRAEQRNS
jgi:hypothetical protein